jgi:hypothetical protein
VRWGYECVGPQITIGVANAPKVLADIEAGHHQRRLEEFRSDLDHYWRIAELMVRFKGEEAESLLAAISRGNRERLLDLLAEEYLAGAAVEAPDP